MKNIWLFLIYMKNIYLIKKKSKYAYIFDFLYLPIFSRFFPDPIQTLRSFASPIFADSKSSKYACNNYETIVYNRKHQP